MRVLSLFPFDRTQGTNRALIIFPPLLLAPIKTNVMKERLRWEEEGANYVRRNIEHAEKIMAQVQGKKKENPTLYFAPYIIQRVIEESAKNCEDYVD